MLISSCQYGGQDDTEWKLARGQAALTLTTAPQMMGGVENYILGSLISEVAGMVSVVSVEMTRN